VNRLWLPCLVALSFPLANAGQLGPKHQALLDKLAACPFTIVYESLRDGNWELMAIRADGSNPRNITNTPDIHEMYPKVSPDGARIAFVAEHAHARPHRRHVYVMNIDGTARTKVADDARQPFWTPDGAQIAYARGIDGKGPGPGFPNRELHSYNVRTGKRSRNTAQKWGGLLTPCLSPDGKWIAASVLNAMGLGHSIALVEVAGPRILPLALASREHGKPMKNIYQCRPDISPDGTRIAWGKADVDGRLGTGKRTMWIEVAHIDLASPNPTITDYSYPVEVKHPQETYHVDWSPDGRFLVWSQGSRGTGRMAGAYYPISKKAKGWDLWVVEVGHPNIVVQITHDGLSNKEPDWVPVAAK